MYYKSYPFRMDKLFVLFIGLLHSVGGYHIYNVEDQSVCNKTIWLEEGPNSAAILRMTSRPSYDYSHKVCFVTFKAPLHNWSGLMGVLEEVDLRRYEDIQHHFAQSVCIDYIMITNPGNRVSQNEYHNQPEQCGSWSLNPDKPLRSSGSTKALVGHCIHSDNCKPTRELEVKIVIQRPHIRQNLWEKNHKREHRGFTFVVTAYTFVSNKIDCSFRYQLRACGQSPGRNGQLYCIHDSLFCDGHINCASNLYSARQSADEQMCPSGNILSGLPTVLVGPWVGTGVLLLIILCTVIYRNRLRERRNIFHQFQHGGLMGTEDHVSVRPPVGSAYPDSYEMTSSGASSHHMAIQVRVVCNTGNQSRLDANQQRLWKLDLPPSYETLFPNGPPTQAVATRSPPLVSGIVPLNTDQFSELPPLYVNDEQLRNQAVNYSAQGAAQSSTDGRYNSTAEQDNQQEYMNYSTPGDQDMQQEYMNYSISGEHENQQEYMNYSTLGEHSSTSDNISPNCDQYFTYGNAPQAESSGGNENAESSSNSRQCSSNHVIDSMKCEDTTEPGANSIPSHQDFGQSNTCSLNDSKPEGETTGKTDGNGSVDNN